jgi:hypothetical protein
MCVGAAQEVRAAGTGRFERDTRQEGIPNRGGNQIGFKSQLPRARSAFVEGGHGDAPVAGGLRAVGLAHLDLDEFLGFGEGGGIDFGAHGLRGSKCGRCARCPLILRGGRDLCGIERNCCANRSHGADGEEVSP